MKSAAISTSTNTQAVTPVQKQHEVTGGHRAARPAHCANTAKRDVVTKAVAAMNTGKTITGEQLLERLESLPRK